MARFHDAREAATPGHHLMRVRIRKSIFEQLQELAEDESERTGEHVTVSDLVRVACYNHLLIHVGLRQLENLPFDDEYEADEEDEEEDDDEEEDEEDDGPALVTIILNPMLR